MGDLNILYALDAFLIFGIISYLVVYEIFKFIVFLGFTWCYVGIISIYGIYIGLYKFQEHIEYLENEKGDFEYISNNELLLVFISTCCYSICKSIVLPFDICHNIISYYLLQ